MALGALKRLSYTLTMSAHPGFLTLRNYEQHLQESWLILTHVLLSMTHTDPASVQAVQSACNIFREQLKP